MAKTIVLTGGGTAGHVTPNLALLPQLRAEGFFIHYIGSRDGIEKKLIEAEEDVQYHAISCGKLRRYFSWKNFSDAFRVLRGVGQARRVIRRIRPDVVFSKGGFVSVPVCVAARKIPLVTHESDYTPGLANRINARFADRICVTFEDTLAQIGEKGVYTGTPIRPALYDGDWQRGKEFLDFTDDKPILLVMGGSLGAQAINEVLRAALSQLQEVFNVVHLCGAGKHDDSIEDGAYRQYEYLTAELPDILAAADLVVSRAGANAVFELLALAKPMLLIPLPCMASRGDQVLNAGYFAKKGFAMVLEQEDLSVQTLLKSITELYSKRLSFTSAMQEEPMADGTEAVLTVIREMTPETD